MIIDGKAIAAQRIADLRLQIADLKIKSKLVAVMVGEDPGSQMYIKMKSKRAEEVGIISETIVVSGETTDREIRNKVQELNKDKSVTGILIQLPFPKGSSAQKYQREILDTIDPVKDVDCLTSANMGLLAVGKKRYYPATVRGILSLLNETIGTGSETKDRNLENRNWLGGKNVTVIGRSEIVGKPMAMALINLGATVTVCNSKSLSLSEKSKSADILISATGVAGLITKEMVKPGAIVIDAGISKIRNSKLEIRNSVVGDVDFEAVQHVASAITPVPGGVGPMTIVSLLENTLEAFKILHRSPNPLEPT